MNGEEPIKKFPLRSFYQKDSHARCKEFSNKDKSLSFMVTYEEILKRLRKKDQQQKELEVKDRREEAVAKLELFEI